MNFFLKLIISGLFFACTVCAAPHRTDSMLQALSGMPQDTFRLKTLRQWIGQVAGTPDEVVLLNALLRDAQAQNDLTHQAYAYSNLITAYFNYKNRDSILSIEKPALQFFQTHHLFKHYFNAKSLIISLHTDIGEYEYALLKGEEMYREAEAIPSIDGEISACYALAHAHFASNKYHDAIFWNRKGLELLEGQDNYLSTKMNFNYILAESYQILQQPDSMIFYTEKVREVINNYEKKYPGEASGIIAFYYTWINCRHVDYALYHNDLPQAKKYLGQATFYQEKNRFDLYSYFSTCADYYRATGQYDKAFQYIEKETALREKNKDTDPSLLKKRALIYNYMGNDSLALREIYASIQLSDSLNRQRFTHQSDQLRSIYEINRLETEGKKQEGLIRIQFLTLVCLALFLLLLVYYLFKFYCIRKQLSVAAREADEANSATSGFLHNMQRGIQAFLQDIARVSDRLIEESDPAKRAAYADRLRAQNELAQHVIFNILDVSKIESDRMKFHFEEINLKGLIQEVASSVRHTVGNGVEIKILADEGLLIQTDLMRLHQILSNVLRYAVSHTAGKEIRLACKKEGLSILFSVSGENWTITEEEQQNMFDRLAQTSGKLQEMELDMIISRGLILKLGGRIYVFTGPDSRIEFIFPLSPTPEK